MDNLQKDKQISLPSTFYQKGIYFSTSFPLSIFAYESEIFFFSIVETYILGTRECSWPQKKHRHTHSPGSPSTTAEPEACWGWNVQAVRSPWACALQVDPASQLFILLGKEKTQSDRRWEGGGWWQCSLPGIHHQDFVPFLYKGNIFLLQKSGSPLILRLQAACDVLERGERGWKSPSVTGGEKYQAADKEE